jgi:eukaryotic-like serine/threonine-protein kinase
MSSHQLFSSTRHEPHATRGVENTAGAIACRQLSNRYQELIDSQRLHWTSYFKLDRLLGSGGQGRVYLSASCGADGFTVPVAMKVFSPERYLEIKQYDEAMSRVAAVAAKVALIQHDNLLDVHNFVDRDRIRIMVMEWIDGFDLRRLQQPELLRQLERRVVPRRWRYINEVILQCDGPQCRFKPGVAVAIVRECLAALAALHREGIVHGDVKPSNIMLKRSGHAKLIDIGSAFPFRQPTRDRTCTPAYAAPEVLEQSDMSPRSDLASIGYVLVELLSGQPPLSEQLNLREMLEAKRLLPLRLETILPEEVACNGLLMNFIRGLIAADPNRRFIDAETAEHVDHGAAAFHRQLVRSDLASEYANDLRVWIEELKQLEGEPLK